VPCKEPFVWAVFVSSLFFLALVGAAAALFAIAKLPSRNAASLLIGFVGLSAILWLFSFFKRRSCLCPLCRGTPFLDNSARQHEKARRLFPLNYGTSNVIRALVRQDFRCQYCGTPFDLLKPVAGLQIDQASPPPALRARIPAQQARAPRI
jgi:hypothetical protein